MKLEPGMRVYIRCVVVSKPDGGGYRHGQDEGTAGFLFAPIADGKKYSMAFVMPRRYLVLPKGGSVSPTPPRVSKTSRVVSQKGRSVSKATKKPPAAGGKKPTRGVCQECGCTLRTPCPGGCGWANTEQTLCTACDGTDLSDVHEWGADLVEPRGTSPRTPNAAAADTVIKAGRAPKPNSSGVLAVTKRRILYRGGRVLLEVRLAEYKGRVCAGHTFNVGLSSSSSGPCMTCESYDDEARAVAVYRQSAIGYVKSNLANSATAREDRPHLEEALKKLEEDERNAGRGAGPTPGGGSSSSAAKRGRGSGSRTAAPRPARDASDSRTELSPASRKKRASALLFTAWCEEVSRLLVTHKVPLLEQPFIGMPADSHWRRKYDLGRSPAEAVERYIEACRRDAEAGPTSGAATSRGATAPKAGRRPSRAGNEATASKDSPKGKAAGVSPSSSASKKPAAWSEWVARCGELLRTTEHAPTVRNTDAWRGWYDLGHTPELAVDKFLERTHQDETSKPAPKAEPKLLWAGFRAAAIKYMERHPGFVAVPSPPAVVSRGNPDDVLWLRAWEQGMAPAAACESVLAAVHDRNQELKDAALTAGAGGPIDVGGD